MSLRNLLSQRLLGNKDQKNMHQNYFSSTFYPAYKWFRIVTKRSNSLSWWRHQMEPFSAFMALCAGNSRSRWIPRTKASDAKLWYFFDLRLNIRLSKQPRGWWFETPLWSLWRQCYDVEVPQTTSRVISSWLYMKQIVGFDFKDYQQGHIRTKSCVCWRCT